jgi:uncharacterized OB-fold protein
MPHPSDPQSSLPGHKETQPTLVGGGCLDCGALSYPRQLVCSVCRSDNVATQVMPRTGVIYAFSTVHAAPKTWPVPYKIGYIDLANGVRVFAHLEGSGLAIGDQVAATVSEIGVNVDGSPRHGIVYRPVGEVA